MKRKLPLILAVILLIGGLGFALYPTASQWINQALAKGSIAEYKNATDSLSSEEKRTYLGKAEEYNRTVSNVVSDSFSSEAFKVNREYENILKITDDGQMGTVDIPCINCHLPIYHGSSEEMLEKGAVHLATTSFPIGGESTHAVISAHTALPGKMLFDKLTEVKLGDTFSVTVLGNELTYEVFDIDVVLPEDTDKLRVVKGEDLITLTTCTPYAINTHRLLVTGKRKLLSEVSTPDEIKSFDTPFNWVLLAAVLCIPVASRLFVRRMHKKNEKTID